jgi:hypothetical protein
VPSSVEGALPCSNGHVAGAASYTTIHPDSPITASNSALGIARLRAACSASVCSGHANVKVAIASSKTSLLPRCPLIQGRLDHVPLIQRNQFRQSPLVDSQHQMGRVQTVAWRLTATAQVARTLLTRILARLAGLRSRKMDCECRWGTNPACSPPPTGCTVSARMVDSCVKLPS